MSYFLMCSIWLPAFSFFSIIEWNRIGYFNWPGMVLTPFPSKIGWDKIWTHYLSIVNLVCYPLDQAFAQWVSLSCFLVWPFCTWIGDWNCREQFGLIIATRLTLRTATIFANKAKLLVLEQILYKTYFFFVFFFCDVKLGHFIINYFFSIWNKCKSLPAKYEKKSLLAKKKVL